MIAHGPSMITTDIPPLCNGDRLTAEEFCRRWNATPGLKHAELIGGEVYMNAPVVDESHGFPQSQIIVWLWHYANATEGLKKTSETSVHFGPRDWPQSDAVLRIKDGYGGTSNSVMNQLHGVPELIVEVAASSASYDLFVKKDLYAANSVPEYLVWIVYEKRFIWFALENGVYVEHEHSRNGVIKSRVFPGLWLDTKAMLADNWSKILATLSSGMQTPEYLEFAAQLKAKVRKKRKS